MMNNPEYQRAMNAVFRNPSLLNQLLDSPQLRPLLEANPQIREMLQNPQMRQLLLNPQILQRAMGGLGQGGSGGFGGLSDLTQGLSPSNTPNTRLGELFSQWMDEQRNGGGSAQPQPPAGIEVPRTQPVFQPFPAPDPNVDYKEKYKEQIAQIKEMGFDDEEKIIDALKKCDGNVQYALNRLFG